MNANFEALEAEEHEQLTQPIEQTPIMGKHDVNELAASGQKRLSEIQARLDQAERLVSKLDSGLRPAELVARTAAIRQAASADIEPLSDEILRVAAMAENQIKRHDRVTVLARATFDDIPANDATIRTAWFNRLSTAGPQRLMIFAQQAVESGSLALANAILETIESRESLPDLAPLKPSRGFRQEIRRMIDSIPTPRGQLEALRGVVALRDQLRVITSPKSTRGLNRIAAGLKSM